MGARIEDAAPGRRSAAVSLTAIASVVVLLALAACERERRDFGQSAPGVAQAQVLRMSVLQPGVATDTTRSTATAGATRPVGSYDQSAYAVAEGQQLFGWYNCSGCHSHGGGGMGPALMDDRWIYGSSPEQIYATIVEGRPNGMPSFGGRIQPHQLWQLVAYVRSLSALTPSGSRSSRADEMMVYPGSQTLRKAERPRSSAPPPPPPPVRP